MFRRKKKDKLTIEVDVDTSKAEKKLKKLDKKMKLDYSGSLEGGRSPSTKLEVQGKDHDCNKTCDHINPSDGFILEGALKDPLTVKWERSGDFIDFIKKVLSVKKYQKLAEKYFLEFEFRED